MLLPDLEFEPTEFSLNNINIEETGLSNEEIKYRAKFQKEHPLIEKFRLHCTVCDFHLGTAGLIAKENVRFHARLGVLTCKNCFYNTKSTHLAGACHWCSKIEGTFFYCSSCSSKFCEACIQQNFGIEWRIRMSRSQGWLCFSCDKKQIFPHRAVAYFLYCHYEELKKMKNRFAVGSHLYSNSEPSIFVKDMSTCCKKPSEILKSSSKKYAQKTPTTIDFALKLPSMNTAPPKTILNFSTLEDPLAKSHLVTSKELNPSFKPQSDRQQMLVIEQPSQNHIALQTATCVPSITVNTGTQYIHNVYSDKSCGYTDPSVSPNDIPLDSTKAKNTILHTKYPISLSNNTDLIHTMPQSEISPISSSYMNRSSVNKCVTLPCPSPFENSSASGNLKNCNSSSVCGPDLEIISSCCSTAGNVDLVHDNDPHYSSSLSNKHSSKTLLLQENIKKKPMPKSKKQSLLRSVLMNESIESMKKHLQTNDVNSVSSNCCTELSNIDLPSEENLQFLSNQNLNLITKNSENSAEEPFLKSTIQTATDRLPNLHKKMSPVLDAGSAYQHILEMNESNNIIEKRSLLASNQDLLTNSVPKIKVRAFEELQEQRSCHVLKNEAKVLSEPDVNLNILHANNLDSIEKPHEINVTGLKQGIIEASRTLVHTQKKLKELAKIMSNKLSFNTERTTEMIITFQDILRLCQKQIDVIDSNITSEYCNFVPSLQRRINSDQFGVLSNERLIISNDLNVKKKKQAIKKYPKIRFSRSVAVPVKEVEEGDIVEETNTSNLLNIQDDSNMYVQQNKGSKKEQTTNLEGYRYLERKQDSIDASPPAKKVMFDDIDILDDLEQISKAVDASEVINDHEQISAAVDNISYVKKPCLSMKDAREEKISRKKKKEIWSYRCKKKVCKRSKIIKKGKRSSINLKGWNDFESENMFFPQFQSQYKEEKLRKRQIKSFRPLRSSERNHPSTAALAASTFQSPEDEPDMKAMFPCTYVLQPCSVIIHKLNPRIVEMWEKRI